MIPKAPLAECETCPLKDRPFVGSDGPNYQVDDEGNPITYGEGGVIAVGEAPGVEETNQGVPFVGRSGQLLRKVFTYHKINPEKVHYTNTVLCHPPYGPDGKQMAPNAKAIAACRPRLMAELAALKPEWVIALGTVASKSVLGSKDGITTLRKGRPHTPGALPTAKVITTFHPAAALRDPDRFPSIVSDIGKMHRISVGWEPTRHEVANPSNALALLRDQLDHSELLAGDIELDKPFDRHDPNLLCFGIAHQPGRAVVYPVEVMEQIRTVLNRGFSDRRWAWQNGKFDIQYLWSLGFPNAKVDADSMLAHYATNEVKGTHDLEQIATEVLGAPFWKQEARNAIKEEDTLGFLPKETLWRYNATDADVTLRLIEPLHKEMASDGTEEMYEKLLIPASDALAHMEYRGVRVDLERLEQVASQVAEIEAEYEARLHAWVENPRSPMQVMKVLESLGFNVPNTQEDTIAGLGHPFVEALLDYRGAQKIHSTYIKGLYRRLRGDRIHPTFLLHGTETGRTSCRNPNLQNQPIDHPVREAFTASLGNLLVEADYSGIELRVLATVAKDPSLRQRFIEGRNPHKELAEKLYGPGYSARQYVNTKSINFGTPYMETAGHLAARLGMKTYEAKKIQDAFYEAFPRVRDYQKETIRQIQQNQYLTSMYGRKRRFWLINRDNAKDVFKEGVNFRISSPASDIMLSALIKIHREKPYLNPIITVHDSLMFDVPEESAEEAQREIVEAMESVNPLDVPIKAEAERSFRWKLKS